ERDAVFVGIGIRAAVSACTGFTRAIVVLIDDAVTVGIERTSICGECSDVGALIGIVGHVVTIGVRTLRWWWWWLSAEGEGPAEQNFFAEGDAAVVVVDSGPHVFT